MNEKFGDKNIFCNINETLDHNSDHFPIESCLNVSIRSIVLVTNLCYHKTNQKVFINKFQISMSFNFETKKPTISKFIQDLIKIITITIEKNIFKFFI